MTNRYDYLVRVSVVLKSVLILFVELVILRVNMVFIYIVLFQSVDYWLKIVCEYRW